MEDDDLDKLEEISEGLTVLMNAGILHWVLRNDKFWIADSNLSDACVYGFFFLLGLSK